MEIHVFKRSTRLTDTPPVTRGTENLRVLGIYRAEEPLNDIVAPRTMSDGGFGVAEAEAAKVLVPDCLYNRNVINSFEHVRHSLRTFFCGIHFVFAYHGTSYRKTCIDYSHST